jgi:HAE1 family hydrophobic/amphiphilic exporter-1
MVQRFIKRPVLSTVVSILLVILGILGFRALPVSLYPEIAPPTIQVTATYPGANAQTVLNSVVAPLEEQINGVEGMTYITSTASNTGRAEIQVFFDLGTDPDIAAVNVQNRVSQATSRLPQEVTQTGVTTEKQQTSRLLIFSLYSPEGQHDATFIENYARINLIPQLQRVNGVGAADAFGSNTYSMRVWLQPEALAAHDLTPNEVTAAINEQSFVAGPGAVGENSEQSFQYTLRYEGRLSTADEYEGVIVREASESSEMLRLGDVARVELGAQSYGTITRTNGGPSAGLFVSKSAGANAQEVVGNVKTELETAAEAFPEGMEYTTLYDANSFLNASVSKVYTTLIEAFLLVFLVVFIFLHDWRATLIPAAAVPVSIIGTFFFLNLFGFSINLLTLFAMVLAIGIVVDDAIIVVEIIHAKLEEGLPPMEAAVEGMKEITAAIVSVTLVMAAIFVPVTFIPGSTGVFFEQFGITLAVAITISAVNALTLSPALSALFLRKEEEREVPPDERNWAQDLWHRYQAWFEETFDAVTRQYKRALGGLTRYAWTSAVAIVVAIGLVGFFLNVTPGGFVPDEDQGTFFANVSLPPSASLERTQEVQEKLDEIVASVDAIDSRLAISGFGIISGAGSSYGFLVGKLKPWGEREASVNDVIAELQRKTERIKEADIAFFSPPVISGFGNTSGFTVQLQDRQSGTVEELAQASQKVQRALSQRPEIQYATSYFSTEFPQYEVDVDVPKAQKAGLTPRSILNTMQTYVGSRYVTDFNRFGKQYRVYVQAEAEDRASEESLQRMFVKNERGEMAPINSFVSLNRVYGAQNISRFNLFKSVEITGAPMPGYSSGDAIDAIKEVFDDEVSSAYGYAFSGLSREEEQSSGQELYIFLICLIFVYFLLSAQYESYLAPWAVILPLSIGLAGAYAFANVFGISNNVYLQIAAIMLMGLLAKNAVLIVDFALVRRRDAGMSVVQSALRGAEERFRPILMTSFAFIAGLLPLAVATGVNANANRAIGIPTAGGMLIGTLFGLFVVPVLFVLLQRLQETISGVPDAARS